VNQEGEEEQQEIRVKPKPNANYKIQKMVICMNAT
jgi:hypothetical protein